MRSFAVLSLVVVGALAACGGHTSSSNPAAPADDAGATQTNGGDAGAAIPDAAIDTGPDLGSDVYPAPHHPIPLMTSLGGKVLANVKIVTVTYVGDAQRDMLRKFDDEIVKGPWWAMVSQGFGVGPGTSGGYVELPDDVSGKTLDNNSDLKPYLLDLVAAGKLPVPDENTLYALYFPPTTTITLSGQFSCNDFGAYHDSSGFSVNGQTIEAAYAVMPDCGGGRTVSASHEFIEAATDAFPQGNGAWRGWNLPWFGGISGGESADLCEFLRSVSDSDTGQSVTRSWVNGAAAASKDPCQPADPRQPIYFNAAVDTTETQIVTTTAGSYKSEGFVTVARGTTRDVPVQVFSEAKLPHDLALYVGGAPKRVRGAPTDPTVMIPIATGVTAKLSSATGHNGTHPTLTITVDPKAPTGTYKFIVRSVLETADFRDWPAMLRVN